MSPPEAPPFDEPWQAQVFALAVSLNERGLFDWSEWTKRLGAEVAARPETGNEAYFEAWLAALEKLLIAKGVASGAELAGLVNCWREAAEATPHGQPIVLDAARGRQVKGA